MTLTEFIRDQIQADPDFNQRVGLGVGVFSGGTQCTFFGGRISTERNQPPDERTLFEIGSITKVFTTTLLADLHLAGELGLDDRVNRYLPPHGRIRGPYGDDVTLRHLSTHTSGLARLPVNLSWKKLSSDNPYADYGDDDLYAGLARCRLKNRPGTRTRYSNWGSGLLGHVLSLVGGADYERLVIERILEPLGMHDTVIQLSDEQQQRLAPGHSRGKPVRNWEFQALAGAGAFYSTVADMLRFVRANLDPGSSPLAQAIELTHEVQTEYTWKWYGDFGCLGPITFVSLGSLLAWRPFGLPTWLRWAIPVAVPVLMLSLWQFGIVGSLDDLALGWHFDRLEDDGLPLSQEALWHNGGTDGYRSYLAFSKQHGTGVVVLANSDQDPDATGRQLLMRLVHRQSSPPDNFVAPV
ncbi:MAG TPA: serine hydrolase [Planctomycetaceae bacterium]